jgi:CheY-like chemotaxis protein
MLQHMERAGWHLLALINDVLDLSRIETGTLAVSSEPVALGSLCQECLRMSEPLALAQNVELCPPGAPGVELTVLGDRTRLRQVLVNLLSNAIKYNRPGGQVHLDTELMADNRVRVRVTDTGQGMRPEQIAQLFQPFNRLGAETGPVSGTGIGLVITRHLVALMGGELEVNSTPGQGTRFDVLLQRAEMAPSGVSRVVAPTLTMTSATAPVEEVAAAAPGPAWRLLYIEDNEPNVALMREIVAQRPDLSLQVAKDPWDGLAQASRSLPHLIALDISLPHMDGYELLGRLRAIPELRQRPIVAVTANALPSDRARGLAAGFDAYCTKPLHVADFLDLVDRLLPEPEADA